MAYCKSLIKFFLFFLTCLASYVLLMVRFILPASISESWRRAVVKNSSLIGLYILSVHLKVKGKPPKDSFILVCNHLSYLDLLIIASQTGTIFIAKNEVITWPFLGAFTQACGTIFIDRKNSRDAMRVSRLMQEAIKEKKGITFFPEGTSTRGQEVLSFKAALFTSAASEKIPVHLSSIAYSTLANESPAYLSVCWWGDMEFFTHFMGLLRLSRIDAQIAFFEDSLICDDPRELAKTLEDRIKKDFQPTYTGEKHEESIH